MLSPPDAPPLRCGHRAPLGERVAADHRPADELTASAQTLIVLRIA